MELPLYLLDIDENAEDQSSVFAVGLVTQPAIERNWMTFAANKKEKFQVIDTEKRILAGPLMAADQPIYRNDSDMGEYYVAFSAQVIEKIVTKYARSGKSLSFNINHNDNAMVNGAFLQQSFIIDSAKGINTPEGFEKLPDGSWFGFVKIDDEQVWNDEIKSGNLKGFSVEGYFNEVKILDAEQGIYENLKNKLLQCLN